MRNDLTSQMKDARKNVNAIKKVADGGTFLDCGANIGEVSAAASEHFKKVVAVEAHPDTAKVLRSRVKALKNVEVLNLAVSNVTGQTFFVSSPSYCAIGATARAAPRRKEEGYYRKVKTVSLLDLMRKYRPSVVKIDIEGSEFDALSFISVPEFVEHMIVEFHSGPERIAPIVASIKRQGFKATGFKAETTWKMQTIDFSRR